MDHIPPKTKEEIRTILDRHQPRAIQDPARTCAAVLIPLIFREGEWYVVVTQRTQAVDHHKGQISFPGGACDRGDDGPIATALRETLEEIGVAAESIEILGILDDYPTITGFTITPCVGVITHTVPYRPNPSEVARVLEVPLSFLQDPSKLRVEQRAHAGQLFEVLFWDHGAHTIWGATAQMLKAFLDLLN